MNRVIFLDIDGPLLPTRMWWHKTNQKLRRDNTDLVRSDNLLNIKLDPIAIEYFNYWVKFSGAKIVLATNWVYHKSVEQIAEMLRKNGMVFELHSNPITPKRFRGSHRMNEINQWLEDNEDTDQWLIVDDDIDYIYFDKEVEGQHIINVNLDEGITNKQFFDGLKHFDINKADILQDAFGIKKLTSKEKEEKQDALDMLIRCVV